MRNEFPYYQIHKVIIDYIGWANRGCLSASEWEEILSGMIEKLNFYIWNQLDVLEKEIEEHNKDNRRAIIYTSEDEMETLWNEHKNPNPKCNQCSKEIDKNCVLQLCDKCLLKDKKFITLYEQKKTKEKQFNEKI